MDNFAIIAVPFPMLMISIENKIMYMILWITLKRRAKVTIEKKQIAST